MGPASSPSAVSVSRSTTIAAMTSSGTARGLLAGRRDRGSTASRPPCSVAVESVDKCVAATVPYARAAAVTDEVTADDFQHDHTRFRHEPSTVTYDATHRPDVAGVTHDATHLSPMS